MGFSFVRHRIFRLWAQCHPQPVPSDAPSTVGSPGMSTGVHVIPPSSEYFATPLLLGMWTIFSGVLTAIDPPAGTGHLIFSRKIGPVFSLIDRISGITSALRTEHYQMIGIGERIVEVEAVLEVETRAVGSQGRDSGCLTFMADRSSWAVIGEPPGGP